MNTGHKNPPQNIDKPNIATFERKYILGPSGIYFRNEKNQYGVYAILIEWRAKPIINLIGVEKHLENSSIFVMKLLNQLKLGS